MVRLTVSPIGIIPILLRKSIESSNRAPVHCRYHIPGFIPAFSAGELGSTVLMIAPSVEGSPRERRQIMGDIFAARAQPPAAHFSKTYDLIQHCLDHGAGHRESNTNVGAGGTDNGRVDTDQLSLEIDQRAA